MSTLDDKENFDKQYVYDQHTFASMKQCEPHYSCIIDGNSEGKETTDVDEGEQPSASVFQAQSSSSIQTASEMIGHNQQTFPDANENSVQHYSSMVENNYMSTEVNSVMYVWGDDSVGQLGASTQRNFIKRPKKCVWNLAVRDLSCGVTHMAVISQDGQLFVAGSNSHGKLGIDLPKTQTVKIPTPVPTLSNQQIQQVSCGADYTLALSLSGLVYAWGQNLQGALGITSVEGITEVQADRPTVVSCLQSYKIEKISAGDKHSLFLTEQGMVFGLGSNAFGQLGVANRQLMACTPQQITAAGRPRFCQVAAGKKHSLFLGVDGEVWSAGQQADIAPVIVKIPGPRITSISCHSYSLALSESGTLFMWGCQFTTPTKVSAIPGKVVSAQVGRSHLSAIDDDGIVWIWGKNKKGELGLGDSVPRFTPYPLISLKGKQVQMMASGKRFSVAFSKFEDSHPAIETVQNKLMALTQSGSSEFTSTQGMTTKMGTILQEKLKVVKIQQKVQAKPTPQIQQIKDRAIQASQLVNQQIMAHDNAMKNSNASFSEQILLKKIKQQGDCMERLANEVKEKIGLLEEINEELEAERSNNRNLEGQKFQVLANVRTYKRTHEKNADLQHEVDHNREYVDDLQRQVEIMKEQLREKNVREQQHQKTVSRMGEQVRMQNEQIGELQAFQMSGGCEFENTELQKELDSAKLLLNQKAFQISKYEKKIDQLHEQINTMQIGLSQNDITTGSMQRRINNLEHELQLASSTNEQEKLALGRLDTETNEQSRIGAERERHLAEVLEKTNKRLRDEQDRHLETQMKLRDAQACLEETKIELRQERNMTKLLSIESKHYTQNVFDRKNKNYEDKRKRVITEALEKDKERRGMKEPKNYLHQHSSIIEGTENYTRTSEQESKEENSFVGTVGLEQSRDSLALQQQTMQSEYNLQHTSHFRESSNEKNSLGRQRSRELLVEGDNSLKRLKSQKVWEEKKKREAGDQTFQRRSTYDVLHKQTPFSNENAIINRSPPRASSIEIRNMQGVITAPTEKSSSVNDNYKEFTRGLTRKMSAPRR